MKSTKLKIGDIYENKSLQRIYLVLDPDSKIHVGKTGFSHAVKVLILKSHKKSSVEGRSIGKSIFVSKNFLRKESGTIKIS